MAFGNVPSSFTGYACPILRQSLNESCYQAEPGYRINSKGKVKKNINLYQAETIFNKMGFPIP